MMITMRILPREQQKQLVVCLFRVRVRGVQSVRRVQQQQQQRRLLATDAEQQGPQVLTSKRLAESASSRRRRRLQSPPVAGATSTAATSTSPVESRENTPITAGGDEEDPRSPLERFRTKPRKAFSVTDLVSPAWCELQYQYTLSQPGGRKRRTPAMRQGSAVHRVLEAQVHATVEVSVASREDAFGLRLWNVVQGLETLRATGVTRELEVWGLLEGQVVNGVIDELSFVCPDQELEERATAAAVSSLSSSGARRRGGARKTKEKERGQAELTNYYSIPKKKMQEGHSSGEQQQPNGKNDVVVYPTLPSSTPAPKVYICDVKTRAHKGAPPKAASFRPTLYQLMLYRLLLSELAAGKVPLEALTSRYDLDADAPFSDAFIAQVLDLEQNNNHFHHHYRPWQKTETDSSSSSSTTLEELDLPTSIRHLWTRMQAAFRETFPHGAASIGHVLRAEYRSSADGSVITGSRTFAHDPAQLGEYLEESMRWWRGERGARGVPVEEAYKCRSCEFHDGCQWRLDRVRDATVAHRVRMGLGLHGEKDEEEEEGEGQVVSEEGKGT